jgi:hypothetical protein
MSPFGCLNILGNLAEICKDAKGNLTRWGHDYTDTISDLDITKFRKIKKNFADGKTGFRVVREIRK